MIARLILLGLLTGSAALADDTLADPVLAVDPDEPGPSLPPVGRSLFDFLTMHEEGGRTVQTVPFPFSALQEQIETEVGVDGPALEKVLIPLGRSLQRNAANPDFFAFPRAVVAVDRGPALRPDRSGMLLENRLYLGYQEKAATLEVISYNEAAGRFEYQVVRDYREGGAANVYYADRPTCIACHRNHAPIFSKPLWDETNANAAIAATLAGLKDTFYGIPVAHGVDIPRGLRCRDRSRQQLRSPATGLAGGLRFDRLPGGWPARGAAIQAGRQPPPRAGSGWFCQGVRGGVCSGSGMTLWPGGLAVPDGDLPNRIPLTAPLDPHVPLSEADATRLSAVEPVFEPFEPRPPHEIWTAPQSPEQGQRLVQGLAQFVATADIQRLDSFLWQQDAPTRDIQGACDIVTVDLPDDRREIRIGCPGPEGLMLQGYVQLRSLSVLGGAISRLQIDGQVLTNLEITGGTYRPGLLVLQLEERSAGLHARLPDGNAIRQLQLQWTRNSPHGTAVATVADDFALVRGAVAAMQKGHSDALSAAPMRRAALMARLFTQLGAGSIAWCCLDDSGMPAAALEP